ncbi:hypothetical protein CPB84DRAFT_113942 [Gymnopilus junonius]|uniref:Uncharacterized protein n=1 Tax=Gymnopilus junonius TaxID=109634 RepID=A0A9P5NXR5_GYMJU|nr:hypothetical protein CPB84DRAFT_113942 [Gymnopilus junonius]
MFEGVRRQGPCAELPSWSPPGDLDFNGISFLFLFPPLACLVLVADKSNNRLLNTLLCLNKVQLEAIPTHQVHTMFTSSNSQRFPKLEVHVRSGQRLRTVELLDNSSNKGRMRLRGVWLRETLVQDMVLMHITQIRHGRQAFIQILVSARPLQKLQ